MTNKKWVYGLVIALVAIIALGAGVCFKARSVMVAKQAQMYTGVNNPVYSELFLLNSSNLKLNAEQAKAVLPLLEQMKNADSTTSQELARQIYARLNSQQYQALLARGDFRQYRGNSRMDQRRMMMNRDSHYGKNKGQSQLLAALPDLVVKQLQEIAAEQSSSNQSPAAASVQNQQTPQAQPGAQSGPRP